MVPLFVRSPAWIRRSPGGSGLEGFLLCVSEMLTMRMGLLEEGV